MALGSVELNLYVYSGTVGSYNASDLKYTISKNKISGQSNIVLEIGELVRDYITHEFNNDYVCNAKWVTASVDYFDDTDELLSAVSPATFNYIAVDGYGYFEDGINPELARHALITANRITLPQGTAGKFPIFAEGVGKVRIDSSDTQITDSGNSNQKIQYITIPANTSTIKIYDTDDTTVLKTVTVDNICEPKFTPIKATFVNRLGAYEDVYFYKKTIESFDVRSETFKTNTINHSTVTYGTNAAQKQLYNVNANTRLTLNTGFVHEDTVSSLEELMISENVWLRYENKTLPVLPVTKNMTMKSSLNDRLIDYAIDFEFSFDKINNIR